MPESCPLAPLSNDQLVTELAKAIRSGGRLTREADLYLAGVCAAHVAERLAIAGLVVMRAEQMADQGARLL